ncbi:hypothetical protein GTO89_02350 [Heliobacterium gestii]|uniref:Class III cytochrome C family protein n=1 Tax=Heliomicrobium gestii TaxID=2699 RepID=A0A845LEA4_HELGE|nr:hypothetical protein [Heliomicrobium gestii]MBM7865623.1 hypothetical protein [Heliomicrobium gestii]MZP41873.1 hypothetical protein [Heliomicrobium gestii]
MTAGIKKVILLSFAIIAVSAIAFSMQEHMLPESFYAPGHLSRAHEEVVQGCADCHQPWSKVTSESCAAAECHSREMKTRQMSSDLLNYHEVKKNEDCTTCHRAHQGAAAAFSARFDHDLPNINQRCAECHQGPKGHDAFGKDCAACHKVEAWKPASFDHGKYFPLVGDHKVACAECHQGGDYKSYSCASCHSQSEMLREHHTSDYGRIENCVKCHGGHGEKRTDRNRFRRETTRNVSEEQAEPFQQDTDRINQAGRFHYGEEKAYQKEDLRPNRRHGDEHGAD